jgi:hypothetical protein
MCLNLLKPSGPVKACNGIALPLRYTEAGGTISRSFYSGNVFSQFEFCAKRSDVSVPELMGSQYI